MAADLSPEQTADATFEAIQIVVAKRLQPALERIEALEKRIAELEAKPDGAG